MSTATETPTVDLVVLEDLFSHDLACVVRDCERTPFWSVTWSCGCTPVYCNECWMLTLTFMTGRRNIIKCDRHQVQPLRAVKVVPL